MRAQQIVRILVESDAPVRVAILLEASVHLPRRGSRWIATFRDEKGRQVWRSTGLQDRDLALTVAREWEAEARRRRAAGPAPSPKPTIRVLPGSTERELGLLTQSEVALILGISERAVREIERRAFEKIRDHPALREFWPKRKRGEVDEAGSGVSSQQALSPAEVAAVCALARTPAERQALRKLLVLTQGGG